MYIHLYIAYCFFFFNYMDSYFDLYYLICLLLFIFWGNTDRIPQAVRGITRKRLHRFGRNGGNGTRQKKPRNSEPGSNPGSVVLKKT